jgi:hypothetical protein
MQIDMRYAVSSPELAMGEDSELIVATRAGWRGCIEIGADGNGNRRQSLVCLFSFLFLLFEF